MAARALTKRPGNTGNKQPRKLHKRLHRFAVLIKRLLCRAAAWEATWVPAAVADDLGRCSR